MWNAKKKPCLRKIAHHNSFFARNLKKSQRRVFALKQHIKKLKKEQELHRELVEKANRRADDILSFGMREDTLREREDRLRTEIKELEAKRGQLYINIAKLEELVKQIKLHIRDGLKRH
jgi:predicted  nucleic acid-binding Zn-ribbon protein|tara:strand:+ start:192 stop:548 length:357 start_codon:yes stop_codon:yes gene_type:complete